MLPRKKVEALKSEKAFPMVIYMTSAEGQELLCLLEAFYQADNWIYSKNLLTP